MPPLDDRVAVVTGGRRGIGRAIVNKLVDAGATVVATGTRPFTVDADATAPGSASTSVVDLRKPDDVTSLRDEIMSTWGRVDLLINNAGVGHFGSLDDLALQQWDEMMEVNLRGTFLACRAFIPAMKTMGSGHIINIASVAGLTTFPKGGGYCASKWGVMALSDTLRQELKSYEIKVSVICPGSVQTEFGGTPAKPYSLRPEDVAEAVLTVATSPPGVIMNQVVMRPLVPKEYQ